MSVDVQTVPRDLQMARQRLREMRDWIDSADEPLALASAVRTLYEVREWIRIRKVAGDLRTEACRLEAIALRNLGQMGSGAAHDAGLSNVWVATANGLASMDNDEFDALLARAEELGSPHTMWNSVRKHRAAMFRQAEGRAFSVGGIGSALEPNERGTIEPRDVADAARTILTAALAEGEGFTVSDVTDSLVAWIRNSEGKRDIRGVGSSAIDDPAFRLGVSEVVRKAASINTSRTDVPAFITFYDGNEGWSRIPWTVATLPQLEQMARYRREQAIEMASAATVLESLVSDLAQESERRGGETSLWTLMPILESQRPEVAVCSLCHLTRPCGCDEIREDS